MSEKDLQFYIGSKANALQIPDMKTALHALKLMRVDAKGKGIRHKDDAIRVIIEELDKGLNISTSSVKKETSRGLRKAIEDDQQNREKLSAKYDSVQSFYKELPPSYQKDLCSVFPGVDREFENRKKEIQSNECTILVVGETASGKSSLINLLLGGVDLLPTSQLGCTATTCEIRTNKTGKKEAVGYFRSEEANRHKSKTAVFDLKTEHGIRSFQKAMQDNDEDGNSPFKRIEVTWPFPMLEEGIVIVDTPGIGGSGGMAKYAEKYLTKSFGFIYVINSANAGGVQKGRLQNFMRLVINAAGEDGFNTDSTMFVCNRWDMIPERDREAVKTDTIQKLSRFYTDLKRSQVHYMSIAEATKALQYNETIPAYAQLMDMVEKLLPDTLRARLNSHYRWMCSVMKRSIYSLKVSKVMQAKSMERVKAEFAQVKRQIATLEQKSRESMDYLKSSISQESEIVCKKVVEFLRSRHMTDRLFDWQPHEFPKEDKKKFAETLDKISNKIAVEINLWERENNIVHGIREKIIRVCKRDFELMENQIVKFEGALLDGDSKTVHDLHKSFKRPAPVKQLWKNQKAKDGSIDEETGSFKGLGGAVASICSLKPADKNLKRILDGYKTKDVPKAVQKLQQATHLYLDCIFDSKSMQEKIHTFFKRFIKGIDALAKMIPDLIKADLELMEILRDEMSNTENNLRGMFPQLIQRSNTILGQLDLFFLNYIMVFDYSLEEIDWDPQLAPVGCGSFADVYIADIRQANRGRLPTALKVCRDPLKENTVSDILLEDRTLRELDHPNIVKYYGATYRFRDKKRMKDMQWIMILEVCKYTLKQTFVSPDGDNPNNLLNPGKVMAGDDQVDAMVKMSNYAAQLCRGLEYLHNKGIVHRDLKLENILVTEGQQVKLTDVGLAKPKTDIAFSIVGSPVYMAPEVLLQLQNYDHKADIYGLAIVLWEMWYGKDAADYIQQQLFGSLENAIRDGLRPSLKLANKPPEPWAELIESSWAYEPEKRPSVGNHVKFFEGFINDFSHEVKTQKHQQTQKRM